MAYVDSWVVSVARENREDFIEHSKKIHSLMKDCGALEVVDCWGDDVSEGKITSFPKAVQAKEGEVVVLSWAIWTSKDARSQGMMKMAQSPLMKPENSPKLFDPMLMIMGGFEKLDYS